ncbi:MAG TPA: PEP-CTERM sorting domain-containing protein [Bryobacteraceae bacterium]|nr:PEP-CTERM sorting domain-containing protein [Bryobacteraceae bacterium]
MYDPTSSQDSLTSSFGDSTFTASGKASADYGVLKTYVDGSLTNYAPQSYYVDCPPNACSVSTYGQPAYADASFTDTFTIGGGAGNGYLVIQMSADGTDSQSGPYSVANGAAAVYDSSSNYYLNTGFHGNTTVHTSAIPFTYNTPLTLTFEGVALWNISDSDATGNYDGSGTADYFNTLTFGNFAVYGNPNGTGQVPFSLASSSGTTYSTTQPSSVPEPGTLLLLSGGLLALTITRRRAHTS